MTEFDELGMFIPVPGVEIDGKLEYAQLPPRDIHLLDTPFLKACLKLYSDYSIFKVLPHGQGTMAERGTVIEILKILQNEDVRMQNWSLNEKI